MAPGGNPVVSTTYEKVHPTHPGIIHPPLLPLAVAWKDAAPGKKIDKKKRWKDFLVEHVTYSPLLKVLLKMMFQNPQVGYVSSMQAYFLACVLFF